jgi:hypothetical protein
MENCYCVQLDRLVKEFIVPLEKHINSEQEEKQVVEKEKETQEIVGQKRRARTIDTNSGESSTSASKEMVAVGETRRSKRVKAVVKVAPTYYVPVEEESLEARVVIRNTTLTTDTPRPLDHSSATDENTMNVSNEDTNLGASQRASTVAPATLVHTRRKVCKTFDYKAIKEGRNQGHKFSKADMKRLENAGFVWGFGRKTRHTLLMSA